jgi:hypothetical protein
VSGAEALRSARAAGVSVGINGDHLVLRAPTPPATAALDANIANQPPGFRHEAWCQLIDDKGRFLDCWGMEAARGATIRTHGGTLLT